MNSNHKKPPARNLTITGLMLAGMLAIPLPAHAEQVTHSYDNLNRLIRSDYGNGNVIDYAYDAAGNRTSQTVTVVYDFAGFFSPVDNPPVINTVKAGSAVPVKFSLKGYQGMAIFAANSPSSKQVACENSAATDAIEETVNAGSSGLSYDSSTDTYDYIWKTNKAWANSCRQLTVQLIGGTSHAALFKFKK